MASGKRTAGATALKAFLKRNDIKQAEASRALGVTPVAIHEWLTYTRRPRPEHRLSIARWTSGEVTAESWEDSKERKALAGVEPFSSSAAKPTGTG